jgi:hypothetical protein
MERILPELLLDIFDLVVLDHTPSETDPSFPQRLPIRSATSSDLNDNIVAEDVQPNFRFACDSSFPDFPTGISAHAINKLSPLHSATSARIGEV